MYKHSLSQPIPERPFHFPVRTSTASNYFPAPHPFRSSHHLILIMIIHLVVPAKNPSSASCRTPPLNSILPHNSYRSKTNERGGHAQQRLIAISPREILRPDVLVWVLDAFLQGREMLPVLPVLVPEIPGVDAAEDDAGDYHAVDFGLLSAFFLSCLWSVGSG